MATALKQKTATMTVSIHTMILEMEPEEVSFLHWLLTDDETKAFCEARDRSQTRHEIAKALNELLGL